MNPAGEGRGLREQLQAALGDAYALERELGGGGMSRVFVAGDARLGRRVVVKVLHPDLAAGVSVPRFEREIRLAARLQHPHVVPVLSAGELDGLPYYTMPYVEGESLRVRLERERPLPVAEAVRLLRELADALCHAHEQGVVHRDLKPENVLLSRGHAMVTDFGVAKALASATQGDARAPEAAVIATELGVAVGTPAYMAPEQAVGDAALDHRADLYALGVVAYELLGGAHPFPGRSPQALIAAHLTETPAPLAERRPDTPPALGALVARLLAKRPEDRPASAEQVLRELETLGTPGEGTAAGGRTARRIGRAGATRAAFVALALLALAGTGMLVHDRLGTRNVATGAPGEEAGAPVGIAILPFESRGLADEDYFADGLADAIRSQLAQLPSLRVIDGRSAGQYRESGKSVREIGRELGVPYVLQASVQWARAADGTRRVRVSPALVRVADAATIWSVPLTPEPMDVFAAQAEVAARVAEALDVRLGTRERALLGRAPTSDPAAYDEYLRGLALLQRSALTPTEVEITEATRSFARATELDPAFGLAWAQLAVSELLGRTMSGAHDPGELARSRAALDSATRLAPELPETHLARAVWAWFVDGDTPRAIQALRMAHAARPSDATALSLLSTALVWMPDDLDEAISHAVRAAELDPRSPESNARAAQTLFVAGRYPEALRYAERTIVLAPDQFAGYGWKAQALVAAGAGIASARAVLDSAATHLGALAVTRAVLILVPGMNPMETLGEPYGRRLEALTLPDFPAAGPLDSSLYYMATAMHWRQRQQPVLATTYCDSARAVHEGLAGEATPEQVALRNPFVGGWLAVAYACLGRRAEALRWADALRVLEVPAANRAHTTTAGFALASMYLLLDEPDSAVARLEHVVAPPTLFPTPWLRIDAFFAPLRGHPRFEELLARAPR